MKKYILLVLAGLIFFTSPSFAASHKLGSSSSNKHIARNKGAYQRVESKTYIKKACEKHTDDGQVIYSKGKCTEDKERK